MNEKLNISSYKIVEFTKEEQMVHAFLLAADLQQNLGLMNGKMGMIIWLLKLNSRNPNLLYEDFAFDQLEDIDCKISQNVFTIPIGFYDGLCGIGWGMEYLIRERLMKVDEDVCIGYDPLIQNAILNNRYDNLGVATGLTGALLYLLARIESSNLSIDSTMMFTNKRFIIHTIDQIKEKSSDITLLSFLQEKHNSKYLDRVSLFLSEWEYPVILWAIGRVLHHKILVAECSRLLKMFLTPLTQKDHCPKFDNNKQLLKTVFLSLPPTESLLIDTIKTNLL